MRIAYIFSTTGHTVSSKLQQMILPNFTRLDVVVEQAMGGEKSDNGKQTADDVLTVTDIAETSGDTLEYCGVVDCRPCPDDIDRDPTVAVILSSVASIHASLSENDRVFVRAADGVVELLRVEPHYSDY